MPINKHFVCIFLNLLPNNFKRFKMLLTKRLVQCIMKSTSLKKISVRRTPEKRYICPVKFGGVLHFVGCKGL